MRIILLLVLLALATGPLPGCSSPPDKKIITRSELEKMPVIEKAAPQK